MFLLVTVPDPDVPGDREIGALFTGEFVDFECDRTGADEVGFSGRMDRLFGVGDLRICHPFVIPVNQINVSR